MAEPAQGDISVKQAMAQSNQAAIERFRRGRSVWADPLNAETVPNHARAAACGRAGLHDPGVAEKPQRALRAERYRVRSVSPAP